MARNESNPVTNGEVLYEIGSSFMDAVITAGEKIDNRTVKISFDSGDFQYIVFTFESANVVEVYQNNSSFWCVRLNNLAQSEIKVDGWGYV